MFCPKCVTSKIQPKRLTGLGEDRGNPGTNPSWTTGKARIRRPLLRAWKQGRKNLTFTGDAIGGAPIENHPLEERIVIYILLGPGGAQAAGAAALFLAQFCLVQDLAAAVLCLAEPAIPSCEETGWGGG